MLYGYSKYSRYKSRQHSSTTYHLAKAVNAVHLYTKASLQLFALWKKERNSRSLQLQSNVPNLRSSIPPLAGGLVRTGRRGRSRRLRVLRANCVQGTAGGLGLHLAPYARPHIAPNNIRAVPGCEWRSSCQGKVDGSANASVFYRGCCPCCSGDVVIGGVLIPKGVSWARVSISLVDVVPLLGTLANCQLDCWLVDFRSR